MSKTVVGVFDTYDNADMAAKRVNDEGLRTDDISIIAKDDRMDADNTNDNINRGVTSGTTIGGIAGLLLGMGTIAIPGLGIIAAAGPIAGLLSGAITGGIVGGLIDLGIPQEASKRYEQDVKSGKIVWTMQVNDQNEGRVTQILKDCGAMVEVHDK